MRAEIPFTEKQRLKLKLLFADPPKGMPQQGIIAWIVHLYLNQFKIRVCIADRCDKRFLIKPHGPNQRKQYCSNACRVWQSRAKGGDSPNVQTARENT